MTDNAKTFCKQLRALSSTHFQYLCFHKSHFFFLSLELRDTKQDRFFHSVDAGNLLPVYPEKKKVVSRLLLLNFVLHLD